MLFYSFFKTLVGQPVTVQLKNGEEMSGVIVSVDQFLNIKLEQLQHQPQLQNCFIRGSVVRYVVMAKRMVDEQLLQDATRKELIK
jgi:U6 snRNA-associated Sm-like protein LSm2